ncbi:MAG: tripartite tricarboxylate transporter TctB family protein, partial [Burkholderiales bacterium]|nr:tripartite tricarboxylate transporter TctB family protein [Burkholderiales bacterium]
PVQLRPIGVIVASILLFGWLLTSVGLVITAVAVTLVSACARREVKLREYLWLGAGLALFSALVFVWALSQALPLWWGE